MLLKLQKKREHHINKHLLQNASLYIKLNDLE